MNKHIKILLENIFDDDIFNSEDNIENSVNLEDKVFEHPTTWDELRNIILKRMEKYGPECDCNDIDVSKIKVFACLFNRIPDFNGYIDEWDVSNATDMHAMFWGSKFNRDISMWKINPHCCVNNMFKYSDIKNKYKCHKLKIVKESNTLFDDDIFNSEEDIVDMLDALKIFTFEDICEYVKKTINTPKYILPRTVDDIMKMIWSLYTVENSKYRYCSVLLFAIVLPNDYFGIDPEYTPSEININKVQKETEFLLRYNNMNGIISNTYAVEDILKNMNLRYFLMDLSLKFKDIFFVAIETGIKNPKDIRDRDKYKCTICGAINGVFIPTDFIINREDCSYYNNTREHLNITHNICKK